MIFWDRSRAQTDDTCERSRYYLTGYKGRGIVPVQRPVYFDFGSIIAQAHHEVRSEQSDAGAAARKAEGLAYEATIRSFTGNLFAEEGQAEREAAENACLAGGLITGFYAPGGLWDSLMEDYEVAHAEVELTLEHAPGITFGCRPDLVLRRKADGAYGYPDDKTTGDFSAAWWSQWETDVQLQSGARVIKEKLGYDITFVMVLAHYKGYRSKEYGLQSPLVYGYRQRAEPGMGGTKYLGKRPREWKGWEKFFVPQEMGYADWITRLPKEELAANFAMTRPIAIRPDLVDQWFAQRAAREQEIADATEQLQEAQGEGFDPEIILNASFRQNFKSCTPRRGSPCAYKDVCFLPHVNADPLKSGLYGWRMPHHDTDPLFKVAPPE